MTLESGQVGEKPLLATLRGDRRDVPPVWLMRQAGRYLPEYLALRAEKGGFLDLATDSAAACEITLQPIRRFGMDGAILFSDILMVPWAMGQDLWFEAGEGPRLAPQLVDHALDRLQAAPERLLPVYETVRRVVAALPPETTMLGFAGSPWTVATYMVAGQGSRDQGETRRLAYRDPAAFAAIITAIEAVTIDYLSKQIEAGAEAVQLFDSWSGSLAPAEFERWVIGPTARIVQALRQLHPNTPVIGFPKGAGAKLAAYARETGIAAVGVDETHDPVWANQALPDGLPVQGNLDPLALIAGGDAMTSAVARILAAFADRPHIFNLGHGILPDTPIAHVEQLLALVRDALMEFLASIYLWLKAAHVIFVIFWMAGLFMLPRYLVHHQEALGTPEAERWVEREGKLRKIIMTPSMILVWVFGLTIATVGQHWQEGWLHAKLLLVILMTGYHGWMTAYAKKLAAGNATLTSKQLRLINELPALFVALIVILVVVKPF